MEKGILEDNALEAWAKAIEDCIDIRKGKVTLGYRKNFVGHLHNAVELFVKQRMLNAGIRHRMRTGIGTPTTIRHDIEFATCTASSTDTTPSNFGFFNSTALTMASRTECMLDRSSHSSSFALPSTSLPRWSEQQALNPSRPRTKSTQCGAGC